MDDPIFVDTNVFLRFFIRDVESFYQKAKDLFEKAESSQLKIETSDLVIAEIVWVLESYYDFSRSEIKEVVETILETKNLKVANHSRVKEAVDRYSTGKMDFIDAYNIAYIKAKDFKKVATFDVKHFKNIEGVIPVW
ncbi:MAG: PIN domain-containing protein [Thermodesulfovibrionales bacterium]|nr:PIN domain-containing protein [Thermodesulfovibrionales bacterium]MDP3111598.1 PIN domain-containing protein [Thermodesulfovibrionales bacterium]